MLTVSLLEVVKLLNDTDQFYRMNEEEQADYLNNLGCAAASAFSGKAEIKAALLHNAHLAKKLKNGDISVQAELLRFIEDPEMKSDFAAFYEAVSDDERASAAVHIVSYACAFSLRIVASKLHLDHQPDPVREALPDIFGFYAEQADILGI